MVANECVWNWFSKPGSVHTKSESIVQVKILSSRYGVCVYYACTDFLEYPTSAVHSERYICNNMYNMYAVNCLFLR